MNGQTNSAPTTTSTTGPIPLVAKLYNTTIRPGNMEHSVPILSQNNQIYYKTTGKYYVPLNIVNDVHINKVKQPGTVTLQPQSPVNMISESGSTTSDTTSQDSALGINHSKATQLMSKGSVHAAIQCSSQTIQGAFQDNKTIQGAIQDISQTMHGAIHDSSQTIQGTTQDNNQTIQGTTQDSSQTIQGTTQDSSQTIQGTTQDSSQTIQGTTQDSNQTIQGTTQDSSQTIQSTTQDNSQNIQGTTQDSSQTIQGTTQDSSQTIQGTTQDSSQNIQGSSQTMHGTTDDCSQIIQGTTQDMSQTMQEVIQDSSQIIQEPIQGSIQTTQEPIQGSTQTTQGPIQGSIQTTQEPIQGSTQTTQEPIQGSTQTNQEPLRGSIQTTEKPIQGSIQTTQEPIQGSTQTPQEPLQGSTQTTQEPLQGSTQTTQEPIQGSTQTTLEPLHDSREILGTVSMAPNSQTIPKRLQIHSMMDLAETAPVKTSLIHTESSTVVTDGICKPKFLFNSGVHNIKRCLNSALKNRNYNNSTGMVTSSRIPASQPISSSSNSSTSTNKQHDHETPEIAAGSPAFGLSHIIIIEKPDGSRETFNEYMCNFCQSKSKDQEVFLNHILSHMFVCGMCMFQAYTRLDVVCHVRDNHPEMREQFNTLQVMQLNSLEYQSMSKGMSSNSSTEISPPTQRQNSNIVQGLAPSALTPVSSSLGALPPRRMPETWQTEGPVLNVLHPPLPLSVSSTVRPIMPEAHTTNVRLLPAVNDNTSIPTLEPLAWMPSGVNKPNQPSYTKQTQDVKPESKQVDFLTQEYFIESDGNRSKPIGTVYMDVTALAMKHESNVIEIVPEQGYPAASGYPMQIHHKESIDSMPIDIVLDHFDNTSAELIQTSLLPSCEPMHISPLPPSELMQTSLLPHGENMNTTLLSPGELIHTPLKPSGEIMQTPLLTPGETLQTSLLTLDKTIATSLLTPGKTLQTPQGKATVLPPSVIPLSGGGETVVDVLFLNEIPDDLKIDLNKYFTRKGQTLQCNECFYSCSGSGSASHMREHVMSKHTEGRIWGCGYCFIKKNKRKGIISHVQSSHKGQSLRIVRRKPYEVQRRCETSVSTHKAVVTEKTKTWQCGHCSRQDTRWTVMSEHVKHAHSDQPFNSQALIKRTHSQMDNEILEMEARLTAQTAMVRLVPVEKMRLSPRYDISLPPTTSQITSSSVSYKCYYCTHSAHSMQDVKYHLLLDHKGHELMCYQQGIVSDELLRLCAHCDYNTTKSKAFQRHLNNNPSHILQQHVLINWQRNYEREIKEEPVETSDRVMKSLSENLLFACRHCKIYQVRGVRKMRQHLLRAHPGKFPLAIDVKAQEKHKAAQVHICPQSQCEFYTLEVSLFYSHIYECYPDYTPPCYITKHTTNASRHHAKNSSKSFKKSALHVVQNAVKKALCKKKGNAYIGVDSVKIRYMCIYCDYLTNELSEIRTHLFGSHTDRQPEAKDLRKKACRQRSRLFFCPHLMCDLITYQHHLFENHICPGIGAASEKPEGSTNPSMFKCEVCHILMSSQRSIEEHVRTHSDQRGYQKIQTSFETPQEQPGSEASTKLLGEVVLFPALTQTVQLDETMYPPLFF